MTEARKRVAIGGIAIESSTFSPHRSGEADFTVVRGDLLRARYDFLPEHIDWIALVHARALPGGAVEPTFYASFRHELLEGLRASLPLDGVFLDIHGAMTVIGMEDAEGALAAEVRQIVGADCLISAAMDPHGNLSRRLAAAVDLATSHRMSPHEDAPLTKQRAVANLVGCLDRGIRPKRAWVRVPVLLPGERASTRDEPAKGIYGRLASIERRDGIIDASVWIGYAWADEPRCSAAVLVTGTDREEILRQARALAVAYWDARAEFTYGGPAADADRAIETGLASRARPFFISDSGDNPTAGGANDATFMLGRLLAHPALAADRASAIWASVVDPVAVARCVAAGEGRAVDVTVGGTFGTPGAALPLHGTVERIALADAVGGDIAVVRSGGVRAIVTSRRKPFHFVRDLAALGLDPEACDLTVVKIGYLVPDLFAAAKGWVLALTPGGVDQHIVRLGHQALDRPIYPLDPNMPSPDLEPEVV